MNLRFAKIAARLIANVPRGVAVAPPPPEEERAAGIRVLRGALRAHALRQRSRTVLAVAGAVTALAVAVALVIGPLLEEGSAPSLRTVRPGHAAHHQLIRAWGAREVVMPGDGGGVDLPDGVTVRAGQRLGVAGTGGARLSFSGGTEVRLAERTEIDVKGTGAVQRFHLVRGRLHAEVAPLGTGQRFLIETPDGEVEVHGTVFELAVVPSQPGCSVLTTTRVSVSKGVVEVRSAGRHDHIRAGQHWPAECQALTIASVTYGEAVAPPQAVTNPGRGTARREIGRRVPTTGRAYQSTPSELATQNDLFADAMAAKARGQTTRALELLDRLVTRFPRGPLAEAGYAERMRLCRRVGDVSSARKGARAYLDAFPNGFARSDARLILGSIP